MAQKRATGGRSRTRTGCLRPSGSVAAQAASGASNAEIAAALYVSVNSVETHLQHVYTKLGIRSRSRLAEALADRDDA